MTQQSLQLDPARTAVLALHWQVNVIRPEGFFGPMLADPVERSGVVQRAAAFHAKARGAGVRLVFTRFTIPADGGSLVGNTGFMRAVADGAEFFRPDAEAAALVPESGYDPEADHVSDNQRLSALSSCGLQEWLRERGIDTLLLTGVATNLVVEQTARAATDLGFHTYVVAECVTAVDDATHAASLATLALATEGCVDAADVLAALGAHA
jgi:nicotinamidase-related amidase